MPESPGRCIVATAVGDLQGASTHAAIAAQIRCSSTVDAIDMLTLVATLKA